MDIEKNIRSRSVAVSVERSRRQVNDQGRRFSWFGKASDQVGRGRSELVTVFPVAWTDAKAGEDSRPSVGDGVILRGEPRHCALARRTGDWFPHVTFSVGVEKSFAWKAERDRTP